MIKNSNVILLITALSLTSCDAIFDENDNPANTEQKQSSIIDFDAQSTPLTLEAIDAGTITFRNNAENTVTYQINDGITQTIPVTGSHEGGTAITVKAGDKVAFKGNNFTYTRYNTFGYTKLPSHISCTSDCYIYGNVMSLINADNFATLTELDTTKGESAFRGLFEFNTFIKNHPDKAFVLPALKLVKRCYYGMFENCSGLTTPPALPATVLAEQCYDEMFEGCSGLTTVPELPATTMFKSCYEQMFSDCTSLTSAPALPATTLALCCYSSMFSGCTGITIAPELPASSLVERCYDHMFYGCTKLSSVSCFATDITASNCTRDWLCNVAASGTFKKATSMTLWTSGDDGIPLGWTTTN